MTHADDETLLSEIAKGSSGWGVRDYQHATKLAAMMTERGCKRSLGGLTIEAGDIWIACDYGTNRSPRYSIVRAPKIGDAASYGFNGDYYPCGHVVKVSDASSGARRVETRDEHGAVNVFHRHKLSGSWIRSGGTWQLVRGHVSRMNPSF